MALQRPEVLIAAVDGADKLVAASAVKAKLLPETELLQPTEQGESHPVHRSQDTPPAPREQCSAVPAVPSVMAKMANGPHAMRRRSRSPTAHDPRRAPYDLGPPVVVAYCHRSP